MILAIKLIFRYVWSFSVTSAHVEVLSRAPRGVAGGARAGAGRNVRTRLITTHESAVSPDSTLASSALQCTVSSVLSLSQIGYMLYLKVVFMPIAI